MQTFELRFLRPNNSYVKKVRLFEASSDDAALSWIMGNGFWQRNLEIWRGDRLVRRHVSPAHEARLAGWWPQSTRYPALRGEGFEVGLRKPEVSFDLFEKYGQLSEQLFARFAYLMSPHPIYVRPTGHSWPYFPSRQHCRFSFFVNVRKNQIFGWTNTDIFSHAADGEDIVDDFARVALAASLEAHRQIGLKAELPNYKSPRFECHGELYRNIYVDWRTSEA